MTLLVTEIHNHDDAARAAIVFAADRRISCGSKFHSLRKKLLLVPRFRAAIGYFGLAVVQSVPMAEWLRTHIRKDRSSTMAEFAGHLAQALNSAVPSITRRDNSSGIHFAGFNAQGLVEFWFVRNIDDSYRRTGSYAAREDFQRRDVSTLQPGIGAVYRNGDIDAHVSLWKVLDDALVPLLNRNDFKRVRTTTDYGQWVRFKMDVIAYVYKKWCKNSIIGRPIDVIVITAKDGAKVV